MKPKFVLFIGMLLLALAAFSGCIGGSGRNLLLVDVSDQNYSDVNFTNLTVTGDSTVLGGITGNNISLTDQSSCSVWRSGAQTLTSGVETKIQFNTVDYDNLNEFDETTSYDFNVISDGIYFIHSKLTLAYLGSGHILRVQIHVNDTEVARTINNASRNSSITGDVTKIKKLNAGDSITIKAYHNEGTNQDIAGYSENSSYLNVHKLA